MRRPLDSTWEAAQPFALDVSWLRGCRCPNWALEAVKEFNFLANPRFPLKGSFKGDIDNIGRGEDIESGLLLRN